MLSLPWKRPRLLWTDRARLSIGSSGVSGFARYDWSTTVVRSSFLVVTPPQRRYYYLLLPLDWAPSPKSDRNWAVVHKCFTILKTVFRWIFSFILKFSHDSPSYRPFQKKVHIYSFWVWSDHCGSHFILWYQRMAVFRHVNHFTALSQYESFKMTAEQLIGRSLRPEYWVKMNAKYFF